MRGFLAVCRREIAERRLLFLLGAIGLAPLLVPLIAPDSRLGLADSRGQVGLFLAAVVAAVLAVALGASVVARDLAEGRLGFYFARPLSGWAIWGGKLAAAFLLSAGIGLLVLLPALLLVPAARGELLQSGWGFAAVALLAALVLAAGLVSVIVRSRTAWLGLDLAAFAAVGALLWSATVRLERAAWESASTGSFAPRLVVDALLALSPFVVAALVAASAAQVVSGRTDPRRAHRVLSLTLWSPLVVLAVAFWSYSVWFLAAAPSDVLTVVEVQAAPAGSAVAFVGVVAHRGGSAALFLEDLAQGGYQRIFAVPLWTGYLEERVLFSRDGRQAVWLDHQELSPASPATLLHLDLGRPGQAPRRTALSFRGSPWALALSPDGRLLASLEGGRVKVEDIESARLLASVPSARGWRSVLSFLDASHLRIFQALPQGDELYPDQLVLVIRDLDLATGEAKEIGRTAPLAAGAYWIVSPDASHALIHQGPRRLSLVAARGGAPVAELPVGSRGGNYFLADGRIAAQIPGGPEKALGLYSAEGILERRFPLPPDCAVRLGGQFAAGQLVVACIDWQGTEGHRREVGWDSQLLDLTSGALRPLGRGLLPAAGTRAAAGSVGARLFYRGVDKRQLVLLDAQGRRETVVAGR